MTNYEELKAKRMEVIKSLFLSGHSTEEIINKSGVSKATVYKYIKEMGIRPISFRKLCRNNNVDFNSVTQPEEDTAYQLMMRLNMQRLISSISLNIKALEDYQR